MGKGLVDSLRSEYPIEDEWISYQLRPETPPEGIPVAELFPGIDIAKRNAYFDRLGRPYGLRFCNRDHISNSGFALEAAEFARTQGRHHEFHEAAFKAYFTDCLDIGRRKVLEDICRGVGLDVSAMNEALERGIYKSVLVSSRDLASQMEINAVPTFIIENKERIVGIQKTEIFKQTLDRYK